MIFVHSACMDGASGRVAQPAPRSPNAKPVSLGISSFRLHSVVLREGFQVSDSSGAKAHPYHLPPEYFGFDRASEGGVGEGRFSHAAELVRPLGIVVDEVSAETRLHGLHVIVQPHARPTR